jgi:hypothetical protein
MRMRLFPLTPARRLAVLLLAGAGAWAVRAEEGGDDLPVPVAEEIFDPLLSRSPFRRLLSLSDALVLTGVAKLPDGPMATILDRSSNETIAVGTEPNALGWRIVEIAGGDRLENVQVSLEANGQRVLVRFDPLQIQPEAIRRQRRRRAEPVRAEAAWKREPWVERLDADLVTILEMLPVLRQTAFQEALADFLRQNPDAGEEGLETFARETLNQLRRTGEEE